MTASKAMDNTIETAENESANPQIIDTPTNNYLVLLCACLGQLEESVRTQDSRPLMRMLRRFKKLKSLCDIHILQQVSQHMLWGRDTMKREISDIQNDMDIDGTNKIFWLELKNAIQKQVQESTDMIKDTPKELPLCLKKAYAMISSNPQSINDIEIFLSLLFLVYLLDKTKYESAFQFAKGFLEYVLDSSHTTHDFLFAKVLFSIYRAYELSQRQDTLRQTLLKIHCEACVHRHTMTIAVSLNLLLRNYIKNQLYDQALKLASKTSLPHDLKSPAQHARYLYYIGLARAIRLEYSAAFANLQLALRKVPDHSNIAKGFKLTVLKTAIVVELLMGDIPERHIFNQKETRVELLPYRSIVLAVRAGDLQLFASVLKEYEAVFLKDSTLTLLNRLHHNVIRAGLRIVCLSYSCITLEDIAKKLRLPNVEAAESMVSKAIADGIIEATIDHEKQHVISRGSLNIYASNEPQKAFNKRIAYCMEIHNMAVKAMEYDDGNEEDAKNEDLDERRRALKEEIARAEDGDIGDDMDML